MQRQAAIRAGPEECLHLEAAHAGWLHGARQTQMIQPDGVGGLDLD